jgi:SAM-dependent methyltransferase
VNPDGAITFQQAAAGAYDRFIGRYGPILASAHIAAARVRPGQRALDVGCGPGPLTAALAELLGAPNVAAVDPSEAFVDECRRRVPGADVRVAAAERLPAFDAQFDVVLSQLVVNFMDDASAGVTAMRAAAREGGTVASCVWDYADGMTLLRAFWDAARESDPAAPDEGRLMRYSTPDGLAELWQACGLHDVETGALCASAAYTSFDDLWEPFTAGIGPAGAYCVSLDDATRNRLRSALHRRLGAPDGPFELSARAWLVRGTA